MTSSLVPDRDGVPSLPSRVVTIDANTMLEVRPERDLYVDFTLTCDLHVPADDKIVMAETQRVHLDRGRGAIRLPTYTDDASTVDGSNEWAIIVRKSWSTGCRHGRDCGCSGPYAIRVPEGTTSISLADLPAVKELTMRERIWRITGASASVTQGAQWDVSAEVRGGVIDFDWTVPPGGTAWNRGDLGDMHLNQVTEPGVYGQGFNSGATLALGYPVEAPGELTVTSPNSSFTFQTYRVLLTGESWTRRRFSADWSQWESGNQSSDEVPSLGQDDLNDHVISGVFRQTFTSNVSPELNYPPITGDSKSGTLHVATTGTAVTGQMYVADRAGEIWVRDRYITNWYPWKKVGGGGGGGTGDGIPRTDMERTGRWTPNEQGNAFLLALGEHELVETHEIGRSVEDRPIYAAVIGDPTLPAVLVNAGAHGTEVGPPEAAWLWVRHLTEVKSLMFMDICVIVVPLQNPDNRFNARGNRNAVDLNRDWVDQSQPETLAVAGLFDDYNIVAAVDTHNFGYPRQVSMDTADYGSPELQGLSQALYDTVHAALEADGQSARAYGPETPAGAFHHGVAAAFSAATLLIEIPCGGYAEWTFDDFYPPPSWQAHVGIVAFDAVAKYVWDNLPAFEALKGEE